MKYKFFLKILSCVLVISFLFPQFSTAQSRRKGEILVQVRQSSDIEKLLSDYQKAMPNQPLRLGKWVADAPFFIARLDFSERTEADATALKKWLESYPPVLNAQMNHESPIFRSTPNDAQFAQQWHWQRIKAVQGWDIARGGNTMDRDTIVIAVIDNGFCPAHEDMTTNMWKNYAETPNDGIDNDQNGFVDDFKGWNALNQSDSIEGGAHGCEVAGVIGAIGNNARGVSGMNWNVKVMPVVTANDDATIIGAYSYVFQQRRLWNQTQGKKGAFVVATNSSFGRDNQFASSAPLWCAMYDSLGSVGIINIAATANLGINVDANGDLPATCGSNALIAVTASTAADVRRSNAAFGPTHIDLAAPGDQILTTKINGGYGLADGTSLASPIVAGLVGLIYAAPCTDFVVFAKQNPAQAVAQIRTMLLRGVDTLSSLTGQMQTNGRINAEKTLLQIVNNCPAIQMPNAVAVINITTSSADVRWESMATRICYLRYKARNMGGWSPWIIRGGAEYSLTGLASCSIYDVEIQNFLGTSSATRSLSFKTDGCCEPTNRIQYLTTAQGFSAQFSRVTAATTYDIRVCEVAQPNNCIFQRTTTDTSFLLSQLSPCTNYSVRIRTVCGGATNADTTIFIKTKGCGACTEANYCKSTSTSMASEWIDSLKIDTARFANGRLGNGYTNFTTVSPLVLLGNRTYNFTIVPGFSSGAYREGYRIWIDLNGNGFFEDSEKMWENIRTDSLLVRGQFTIPRGATAGVTRLRVSMKYVGFSNPPPTACETFTGGEVEDICIKLEGVNSVENTPPQYSNQIKVFPNPFSSDLTIENTQFDNPIRNVDLFSMDGRLIFSKNLDSFSTSQTLRNLDEAIAVHGIFLLRIRTEKGIIWKRVMR